MSICQPCTRLLRTSLRDSFHRPGHPLLAPIKRTASTKRYVPKDVPSLITIFTDLKQSSRRPTPSAYEDLVRSAAEQASRGQFLPPKQFPPKEDLYWRIAIAALEDAHAGGIPLRPEVFDQIIRFTNQYPALLPSLILDLPLGTQPSAGLLAALARSAIASENLEQLIVILKEMFERNLIPTEHIVRNAVRLCCEWGCPRVALEFVQKFEAEGGFNNRIDVSIWAALLASSAENQYVEGVEYIWNRIVKLNAYTPDEGLILSVLAVAGRWGKPQLASKALEILPMLSVAPREHHLVPLLEAYVNAGQVPNAITVLASIRAAGMVPTLATAEPIISVLTSVEVIDQAFYALEDMRNDGQTIDVTALNAVVEASARLGDLQRARATQMAANNLGVHADVDTFNSVLSACVAKGHRQLGDTLLSEMSAASIDLNETTYRLLIALCLTQSRYDDAFFYLEKMKAEGHKPPYEIYRRLVARCYAARDRRWSLVVEELESLGHRLDRGLRLAVEGKAEVSRSWYM